MKKMLIINFLLASAVTLCPGKVLTIDEVVLPLWSGPAPGALGDKDTDIPTLTVYLPDPSRRTGAAVVICPGGGYNHLAFDHEGIVIAQRLQEKGIAAFILKYRLPANGYRHPIPLLDAQRAIRLVRSKAAQWNIDPDRIGIMGFSAGGHLASTAGTHFHKPAKIENQQTDQIDAASCRPDFMVLIYPVISMKDGITHQGSKDNLLGKHPSKKMVDYLSNEKQITKDTPPTFLVHADDDTSVPPENSIRFYEGLRKAGVPAEMHIYLKGGHGFGTRPSAGPASHWLEQCFLWMRQAGGVKEAP